MHTTTVAIFKRILYTFYYLLIELIRYVKGPIRKISVSSEQFCDSILCQEWEWKAEERRENESVQFELSQCNGDSLFIRISTYSTHSECFVSMVHNGVVYQTDVHEAGNNSDRRIFSCGPLLLEVRSPFRRWRICFRGEMSDPSGVSQFVSICGWFKPTFDASFFFSNIQFSSVSEYFVKRWCSVRENIKMFESTPSGRFPSPLAEEKTEDKSAKILRCREDTSQWGEMHVEIQMAENTERRRYRGIKRKGENRETQSENSLSVYFEDGNRIVWHSEDSFDYSSTVSHANHTTSGGKVLTMQIQNDEYAREPQNLGLLNFINEKNETFSVCKMDFLSSVHFACNGDIQVSRVSVEHASNRGIAFIVHRKAPLTKEMKRGRHTTVHFPSPSALSTSTHSLILPFSHISCQDPSLTGGKGSNLARLVFIQKDFVVPRGVVITTQAYNEHVKNNPIIGNLIGKLEKENSLEECLSLGNLLEKTIKESAVSTELQKDLEEAIDFECEDALLAIRSSALGEDGAELSSAGQLESFLNTKREEIPERVKECWASNFRREVISYRKSHAQSLIPPMAVVVQSMVSDGTAGVLFTCDPVSRNPCRIVINAIIGIGEDIVSGGVTPDTVVINRRGEIIEQPKHCCLNEKLLMKLCKIGKYLEEVFNHSQDIEFVVKGERVCLVQSRDITGLDRETEFELLTEFDSGTLTDREILTTANVGEVMSIPQTPLTYSCNFLLYEKALAKMITQFSAGDVPRHPEIALNITRQKVFFNIGGMFLPQWEVLQHDPISEYTLAGEKLFTEEMYSMGKLRFDPMPKWFPIYRLGYMIHAMLWGSQSAYKRAEILCEKIEELVREGGVEELLRTYQTQRQLQAQLIAEHGYESSCSSFTYVIVAMLIRGSEAGDLSPEMLSDIATVFGNSTSHVISADVPGSLKRIARAISNSKIGSEFEVLDGDLALNLLKGNNEIGPMIEEFFTKHGHRGQNELDLYATSWGERPDLLVDTLKLMLKDTHLNDVSDVIDVDKIDVLDQLKNKPKGIARWLMRYMIGQTHKGVALRELAKNLLVKGNVAIRSTVKKIGEKLTKEGFLPSTEHIFFLSLEEIEELWKTRSAKLISRANRRLQSYDKQCGLQYQHVYWGPVEPIDSSHQMSLRTLLQLNGTPVCEGRVIGKARVAKTLDEARETQPGEILITRFTDICWSPFFPIIKGIVTEIGGLLSHGAVVAREYGLPSLIAVTHATQVFQTGDLVELDATRRTISKIEVKSEEEE